MPHQINKMGVSMERIANKAGITELACENLDYVSGGGYPVYTWGAGVISSANVNGSAYENGFQGHNYHAAAVAVPSATPT